MKFIWIILIIFPSVSILAQELSLEKLCAKWHLEGYTVTWIEYEPEKNEINDYILLRDDMTFVSVDEGVYGTGTWRYDQIKNTFTLLNREKEELVFNVAELTTEILVIRAEIAGILDVDIRFKKRN